MAVILGLTAGLIFLQPDLSATLTICALGVLLFFLAGVNWKQIVLIFVVVAAVSVLGIAVSDTGQMRIQQYVNGLQDPATASLHIQRSFEAVVRGGFFGVGIGKGSTKFSLPVSHTDSIFAVIAEETGLLGAAGVVILYLVFAWRGLKIAANATDFTGKLLAAGLTGWIVMEAVINMGVMVNLCPFAGNALPCISAGGSSLTMTLGAVGLILSVARVSSREKLEQEGRSFGAVVNLRRGDRRGRVSRPYGSSGIR
jgi:cell division protein FtsW